MYYLILFIIDQSQALFIFPDYPDFFPIESIISINHYIFLYRNRKYHI